MADPRPWSNDEKNYLLAEIIKQHSPHPGVLLSVIRNLNAQPIWDDLPLPAGRSKNSSRFAYDQLQHITPHTHLPGHLGPQTPLSAPPQGLKRSFPTDAPFTREIRPKPHPAASNAGPSVAAEPPPGKRKRGRPTKADAQAKAAAEAAARAEAGRAPPAQPSPQTVVTPLTTAAAPVEEPRPALPPTTRGLMPISAVLTPQAPKTGSSSSSSSGKRRRGRSMRSEAEGFGGVSEGQQYESPYGRSIVAAGEDTPARTAVLRHLEEQQASFQQPQQPRSDPAYPPQPPGPS